MGGDTRGMETAPAGETSRAQELLAPLRADRARAAILTDVDGTIAPIVQRPEDAAVPDHVRELLASLAETYALVGCISGRRAVDAKRMVGLDQIAYSGNHGFEVLLPGDPEPRPDPMLDGHESDAREYVAGISPTELEDLGIRVEDKGAIVALHWRGSPSEGEAEVWASERVNDAEWNGLVAHRGRMVLEIRPDVSIDKGKALTSLIGGREIAAALYAGDDRTDLDAFAALTRLQEEGRIATAVRVAIAAQEAPPEVAAGADLVVDSPEGFVTVLEALAA
jgi:trehalose 6-phosphate phosphatase